MLILEASQVQIGRSDLDMPSCMPKQIGRSDLDMPSCMPKYRLVRVRILILTSKIMFGT